MFGKTKVAKRPACRCVTSSTGVTDSSQCEWHKDWQRVAVHVQAVKEFWEDDFAALKKYYPHGTLFAFCGCQLMVTGFSYVTTAGAEGSVNTLHPRMHCVYRNSVGDLKEFVFTEHNLPLLLAKTPVAK